MMAVMTDMVTSAVMVGHVKVLRLSMLARVSDGTVARASRISGGLELLLNSSVLVNSVVVQIMTVAAASGRVISLVSSAAQ